MGIIIAVIGILAVIVVALTVWFRTPTSPLAARFARELAALDATAGVVDVGSAGDGRTTHPDVLDEHDCATLPPTLRRYLRHCGYIGASMASVLHMRYRDVDFMMGETGLRLTIDYDQHNFAGDVARLAYIRTSMAGVPFEGYDFYRDGVGGMTGVLGKLVTLFDQRGDDMDRACLVTFLAESLFLPTALLRDDVTLEELDGRRVRATITYRGQHASGVFAFNERYEMTSFTTRERTRATADGATETVPWSAICDDWRVDGTGISHPTKFRAVWHLPDGNLTYFDGEISEIAYR